MLERGTHPPPFFWKCVKRKGFKSFVLKVCETKGVADTFLRKCVNLKRLGDIFVSFYVSRPFGAVGEFRGKVKVPSGLLAITTELVYHNQQPLSRADLSCQ